MKTLKQAANAFFLICFALYAGGTTIEITDGSKSELEEKINMLERMIEEQRTIISNMNADSVFNRDWFLFKMALIKVESDFNPDAVNKSSGAGGIFQIMPVYKNGFLREANRLIGYAEFTDSCRFDPYKSNEMFEIVNARYNPNKSIGKAISLHNPTAGNWYRNRVLKEYEFFKQIAKQYE